MRATLSKRSLIGLIGLFLLLPFGGRGILAADGPGFAAALISREIRPFVMMVEGLEEKLSFPVVRVFLGSDGRPVSDDPRFRGFDDPRIRISVAVGPSALSYFTQNRPAAKVVYGMILEPERIAGPDSGLCGVSLNLFSYGQIALISRTFPEIRTVGVLFDPANSQKWFESARAMAQFTRLRLVPLTVSGNADIARLFEDSGPDVDAILFVPDPTVISKTVIRHVIKKALLHRIPAVGFNTFFHESGAALSFAIDYKGVGEQVAEKVGRVLAGEACGAKNPRYRALVNKKVVKLLGTALADPLPDRVELK